MKIAKFVGYALSLLGAAVVLWALGVTGSFCFDWAARGAPDWNGWPDYLVFFMVMALIASLGAGCAMKGFRLARSATADAEQSALNIIGLIITFAVIIAISGMAVSASVKIRWAAIAVLGLLWLIIAAGNAQRRRGHILTIDNSWVSQTLKLSLAWMNC
ncbi:MAG: hypothetical protein HY747_03475 [Elusimicrobia bacterium]|nr:hypothetical protein [Elusimicrobiota bacterium]